jgi:hypothetical protein
MKSSLEFGKEYSLLNKKQWEFLHAKYKGANPICTNSTTLTERTWVEADSRDTDFFENSSQPY